MIRRLCHWWQATCLTSRHSYINKHVQRVVTLLHCQNAFLSIIKRISTRIPLYGLFEYVKTHYEHFRKYHDTNFVLWLKLRSQNAFWSVFSISERLRSLSIIYIIFNKTNFFTYTFYTYILYIHLCIYFIRVSKDYLINIFKNLIFRQFCSKSQVHKYYIK